MHNTNDGTASYAQRAGAPSRGAHWPELDFAAGSPTWTTLHLWLQMAGKIRLAQSPWVNHGWHVTPYMTAHGPGTSPIPYGARSVQIDFDMIEHRLLIRTSDGATRMLALQPRGVANFHHELLAKPAELDLHIGFATLPSEVAAPIPFEHDEFHCSYEREHAKRLWRAMAQADRVFKQFRARGAAASCRRRLPHRATGIRAAI